MRKALIDIGTNTTHMLIADVSADGQQIEEIVYKKRYYTYLGEYGLEEIHPIPLQKLYDGLKAFDESIKALKVENVRVVATEALRSAHNGKEITSYISKQYGWSPEIIGGLIEAKLIAKGAMQAVDMSTGSYVVMDIGGGSVEFIHVQNNIIGTMITTPLGISRLHKNYHQIEPISEDAISALKSDIEKHLIQFKQDVVSPDQSLQLVGTAGSFEIFMTSDELSDFQMISKTVDVEQLQEETKRLIGTTLEDREFDPSIPANRAKYILVALLLMDTVIEILDINKVVVSKYALKEGAILED